MAPKSVFLQLVLLAIHTVPYICYCSFNLSPSHRLIESAASSKVSAHKSYNAGKTGKPCSPIDMNDESIRSNVLNGIQVIEHSIYFDRVNNQTRTNKYKRYSTGTSPHYYDGPLSAQTCPHLKFRYRCYADIVAETGFNEWTLQIHPYKFENDTTLGVLDTMQQCYNAYNSALDLDFVQHLHEYASPFVKPLNIFVYGNSWMRQVIEALLCLLHSNSPQTQVIKSIKRNVRACDDKQPMKFDQFSSFCGLNGPDSFYTYNSTNGIFKQNDTEKEMFYEKRFLDNNVCVCNDATLFIELMDGTNITYVFAHLSENKTLVKGMDKLKERFGDINTDFDFIVMNRGNHPQYDLVNNLGADLEYFNHTTKPVLFIEVLKWFSLETIQEWRGIYPNLLVLLQEGRQKYARAQNGLPWIAGHACQPGTPSHHLLNAIHLMNTLIKLEWA